MAADAVYQTTDDLALNTEQQQELARHEKVIAGGLQTFYDVGNSLAIIRDQRLYRNTHDTFEDYCQDRWGMQRAHAYRLIQGAEVARNILAPSSNGQAPPEGGMSPTGDTTLLERHARELASVPAHEQRLVYQLVNELTEGKPTASAVRSLAAIANGVIASGHVELEDGEQKPWASLTADEKRATLMANLERETFERMQQHKARSRDLGKAISDPIIEKLSLPSSQVSELRTLATHAPVELRDAYSKRWRDPLL